ncbi:ribosome hibernation-promoting factor, HPF/YfiA family [Clostridium sp.]|uniref:ribosome hibernation-promoting factor, HPF/YfiA family n=1 Tax=Clostridium sp. TaxID=1506 RepID=UPI002A92005E|nr:ribosome-associated translation inhibitor RaiA [Clostridium sp.]MDY6011957.1 ribosome-associated translation inhibitor RaiA [Clostridium sp.]
MKVTLITKNIELTPALKDMVEKKVSKLDKYFEGNVEAKATLTVQKNRHKVEVVIPFNGVLLRAEEITDDMYKSIDRVEEKLERQIRKQKTKLSKRINNQLKFSEIATDNFDEDYEGELVKTKKFAVKPMNVDEAILQMELIGHNFFVYKDADTNNVSVLYKRKDGNYGLLEPEYV